MTTILKFDLKDLNQKILSELKNRFGKGAKAEIVIRSENTRGQLLSEKEFWEIIDLIDWKNEDNEEQVKPLITKLASMPIANIYLFEDMLAEKLYRLDTKIHAESYTSEDISEYFSADDFLYARCAVLANGEDYYLEVLNKPLKMPTAITYEPLLYVAQEAYAIKTGKDFLYVPTLSIESMSNKEQWI